MTSDSGEMLNVLFWKQEMNRENEKGQTKHSIWQSVTYKIEQQGRDEQTATADKPSTYGKTIISPRMLLLLFSHSPL